MATRSTSDIIDENESDEEEKEDDNDRENAKINEYSKNFDFTSESIEGHYDIITLFSYGKEIHKMRFVIPELIN